MFSEIAEKLWKTESYWLNISIGIKINVTLDDDYDYHSFYVLYEYHEDGIFIEWYEKDLTTVLTGLYLIIIS